MGARIKALIARHKQFILYAFFGIFTTVGSLACCYLTLKLGVLIPALRDQNGEPTEILDIIGSTTQWVSGVLIAFFSNKKWVFTEAPKGRAAGIRQFLTFSTTRVGTFVFEVIMNLFTIWLFEVCGYRTLLVDVGFAVVKITSRIWSKVITSIGVIIANYFLSKLVVFRKEKTSGNNK